MNRRGNHDVIIIGAGTAGLSAGLVLARAQADVLLTDAGEPRNVRSEHLHGFLSRDGIPPAEFLAVGRSEVTGYGATVLSARVNDVEIRDDGRFSVSLEGGAVRTSRALLVATGLTDELPHISGLRQRWGRQVHHCPYCHGYEVRGQRVAVICGPQREMSLKQAGLLQRYSDHVTFIANGSELTNAERRHLDALDVRVASGTVSHLVGRPESLDGIAFVDGTIIECDAAFITPVQRPNDELLRSLGCETEPDARVIIADEEGQTSVPGVWAVGNVVTPTAQAVTAAGAASASAIAINGWLLQQEVTAALLTKPSEHST